MSVEKRLRDDARSFAAEVEDFDDELFVEVMDRLGIKIPPGLSAPAIPSAPGRRQRPGWTEPCGGERLITKTV